MPPSGFKYHQFGHFRNMNKRDTYEIESCIYTIVFDKQTYRLFTGDQFGFIHCYNIKEIFDIVGDHITRDKIPELDDYEMNLEYVIQGHKETIKKLNIPALEPRIIISTSNDRKCKLFSLDKGEFIDELRQGASKLKDIPIGIQYYFADPFESKRYKEDPIETGIIYRKDLEKGKGIISKGIISKLRNANPQLLNYSKAITAANAKERLYFETKNCDLDPERSNKWNLIIDLDFIKHFNYYFHYQ